MGKDNVTVFIPRSNLKQLVQKGRNEPISDYRRSEFIGKVHPTSHHPGFNGLFHIFPAGRSSERLPTNIYNARTYYHQDPHISDRSYWCDKPKTRRRPTDYMHQDTSVVPSCLVYCPTRSRIPFESRSWFENRIKCPSFGAWESGRFWARMLICLFSKSWRQMQTLWLLV